MAGNTQQTLFALDCGATNWRLYRVEYKLEGNVARVVGEPQPSPLTSFVDRRLPAILLLDPEGTSLQSIGEVAQQGLEYEETRGRVREYFKPCIGAHLVANPLPHQERYTHAEALGYTEMLLRSVLDQILQEKWQTDTFDQQVRFSLAYPVHWRYDHDAQVFRNYRDMVLNCFPEEMHERIAFVTEPEGAILSLQRQGLLKGVGGVTLIIDVGGSTADIVAGAADPITGELDFIGRYGEPIGGGLYDAELARYIADELDLAACDLAEDPAATVSLRVSAQRLKESLSRQLLHPGRSDHIPQRTITLVLHSGRVCRKLIRIDEATFGSVVGHLNQGFEALIDNALATVGLAEEDVGQAVLVGGGAQLFTIVRYLRGRFGDQKVVLADAPEEAVVRGIGLEYGASFVRAKPSIVFPAAAPEWENAAAALHEDEGQLADGEDRAAWWLVPCPARRHKEREQALALADGLTRVGRDDANDVRLGSTRVSRFHAELLLKGNALEIVDVGSTNGTFVNGERIASGHGHPVAAGDEIRFADMAFVCEPGGKETC